MLETKKIKWLPEPKTSLSQVYTSGVEFSMVNDKYEQNCVFMTCKDFLQDMIYSHLHQEKINIYNFEYDPAKNPPVSMDKCRILLANSKDKDLSKKVDGILDFINQISQKLKLLKFSSFSVANPPKKIYNEIFLFEGSGKWLSAPVMVSMISLLIRIGAVHKKGDDYTETFKNLSNGSAKPYQTNDLNQYTQAAKGIESIIENGYRKFFYIDTLKNYPKIDTYSMHNNSGICSFSKGSAIVPYWNKKLKRVEKEKA